MCILRRPALILIGFAVLISVPMMLGASGVMVGNPAPVQAALVRQPAPVFHSEQYQRSRPPRALGAWFVAAPISPATYTVRAGDSLSSIAAHLYGASGDWPALWWENRAKIPNPNAIRQGQVLILGPHTPTATMLKAALAAIPLAPAVPVAPAGPTPAGTTSPPSATPAPQPQTSAPTGSLQAYAASLWGGQYSCGASVVNVESGWNIYATNPGSGAYGIPQALPGSKMASAGSDWATNGYTQIRWMTGYMNSTYGGPCGAWAHEQSSGWY